jgi:sortase family protein
MSWPDGGYSGPPAPAPRAPLRARFAGLLGVFLLLGGIVTIGVATSVQQHAPQPSAAAAGTTGRGGGGGIGPSLRRSVPVSVDIPAIGVHSELLHLGLNANGSLQVPPLNTSAGVAAWYKYSVTPGQIGTSVIEGHVDSYQGPAIFFRLGALKPGDTVDVKLSDGVTAIFRISGVRRYLKVDFPAKTIYGAANYAALRLITCGGAFDYTTRHYLGSTVVFASLISYQQPYGSGNGG